MENWTAENFEIVGLALIKMAYNFWPIIVFVVGYALWEVIYRPFDSRARPKIRNANRDSGNSPYRSSQRQRIRVNGEIVRPFDRRSSQRSGGSHL